MCGRFALELNAPELAKRAKKMGFEVEQTDNSQAVKPRLNIAPHSYCWVLVPEGVADHHNDHHNDHHKDHEKIPKKIPKKEQLLVMKWSLQPPYTSEPVKFSTFNTRVESLDPLKPTWRCAKQHRCVVFMQGYYEWHRDTKKPYYIYQDVKQSEGNAKLSASSGIMCCLAIWDGTHSGHIHEVTDRTDSGYAGEGYRDSTNGVRGNGYSDGGHNDGGNPNGGHLDDDHPNDDGHPTGSKKSPTFSIVTMPAPTKELESLHTRTPIIVNPEAAMKWISSDWEDALDMVTSLNPTQLVPLIFHQVSTAVNSVKAESPNLNKKVVEHKITDFFKRNPASDPEESPKKMKTN